MKKILMLASNPAVSTQTGWPVGFWWAKLTHPYQEFVDAGYQVTIASPDGGKLDGDAYSDPRHESGYSATTCSASPSSPHRSTSLWSTTRPASRTSTPTTTTPSSSSAARPRCIRSSATSASTG